MIRGASRRFRNVRAASVVATFAVLAALVTVLPPSRAQALSGSVLSYLEAISGLRTVAGQHNKEPLTEPTRWTDQATTITGRAPGLFGSDFGFGSDADRFHVVAAAKQQWQAGSLVTLMWHQCPPTAPAEGCDWTQDVSGDLTDAQWADLVTDGTGLNTTYKQRLDVVVPHLQALKDAGVQVLWRPDHELNDTWAWWGGRPGASGSRRLYQLTHDYLVSKGLTNLIWVWSVKDVNTGSFADYYPGSAYVDVVGLDAWEQQFPSGDTYAKVLAVAGGKPIALAEVGRIPTPFELAAQPRWTYFMVWPEYLLGANSQARIRQTYAANRVLTQGEISLAAPPTAATTDTTNLALDAPAFASSTDSSERPARRAVDGDPATRWSSAFADPQWITMDLGRSYPISSVKLSWEAAYARKYQIQTSSDGTTWKTVATVDRGDGGTDTIALGGRTARYVKMYAWVRGTKWGYSLWEFAVLNKS